MNARSTAGRAEPPQIFISYSREDRRRASEIAGALARQGWSVWWDADVPLGSRYHDSIQSALDAARCVVVLWSTTAVGSTWVAEEAQAGLERNVLLPVLIEDVTPPLGFRSLQAARLWDWNGNEAHPEFRALVDHVASLVGPPAARDAGTRPAKIPGASRFRKEFSTRSVRLGQVRSGVMALAVLSIAIGVLAQALLRTPEKYVWQSKPRDVALTQGNRGLLISLVNLTDRQINDRLKWEYHRKVGSPPRCDSLPFIQAAIRTNNVRGRVAASDSNAGTLTVYRLIPGIEEEFGVKTRGVRASECLTVQRADMGDVHVDDGPLFLARLRANPLLFATFAAVGAFTFLGLAAFLTTTALVYLARENHE